jgi:hypothetical protein
MEGVMTVLDVDYVDMPQGEAQIIKLLSFDTFLDESVNGEDEWHFSNGTMLMALEYISGISVDEVFFCRIEINKPDAWLYYVDADWVSGQIIFAGIGDNSCEAAIEMYLRVARHTGEAFPSRISFSEEFAPKLDSFLLAWKEVGFYKDNPDLFQEDYERCLQESGRDK